MGTGVDHLAEGIDELLRLDADVLDDAELHRLVMAVQAERARLGVAAAALVARWDRRGTWAADGSLSAAHALARDTRCSVTSAATELHRARDLEQMPLTRQAVLERRLSLDHVDLLGRADTPRRHGLFAEHEATLVEQCSRLRFAQAVNVVAYWRKRADAELGVEPGSAPAVDAHLHASPTYDGVVALDGQLDPIGGAVFTAELDRLENEIRLADEHLGVERSRSQRRAAALVEMATRSATAPADGRRPKPLFTVLLGHQSFVHLCELGNGTVLGVEQLAPWLNTADLETVLFDGRTTVVSVSRRRNFVGALRRAIEVRDRHCQHPSGCDVPAERCDIDHIVPRARGGITSQSDGRAECIPHNRDPDKHDHDAVPMPERTVDRLDELRARIRWRCRYLFGDDIEAA
jgi:hypothetical protein